MEILVAMPGNGHSPWLGRVLELTVTPRPAHLPPAIAFDQLDHRAHLHYVPSDDPNWSGRS